MINDSDLDALPANLICGLLATRERLRTVAALALGATTLDEVTTMSGLSTREAVPALHRLAAGGLVEQAGDGSWRLRTEVFAAAAAEPTPEPTKVGEDQYGTTDRQALRVLRTFMPDGRLVSFPASQGKRRIILDHVARAFEPGVDYTEREVDAVLRAFCDPDGRRTGDALGGAPADHVTLRRYLIDEGFMARDGGRYRRAGGTVVLD